MVILGIETSCDETAAAVVESAGRRRLKLLSNVVASSVDLHAAFGGVVPEIAARSHLEVIIPVINQALQDAIVNSQQSIVNSKKRKKHSRLSTNDLRLFDPWDQIDAIAVTQGPGLLGSLLIGVLTARTLAIAKQKPLFAINHIHAHLYASFITDAGSNFKNQNPNFKLAEKAPQFPFLALIVSGGHTQLVFFESHKKYRLLGQTTDDAVGEAYDKVAKMLGLPYPGGPSIDKIAKKGDPTAFTFPKAKFDPPPLRGPSSYGGESDYRFSFSGLKTAVLRAAQEVSGHDYTFPSTKLPKALNEAQKADIAASFQRTAVETLVEALKKAEEEFQPKSIVIAGGVAANQELRKAVGKAFPALSRCSRDPEQSRRVIFPDTKLCTDNAAMIAALGYFQAEYDTGPTDPYTLEPDPGLRM